MSDENREAEFIAKITASTTHEVRNVLAIIKESAGLMGDVLRSVHESQLPKKDRLLRSVDRIDSQVNRGADLLTHLNRFAHSLDYPEESVDLNQEAHQVALLCQRSARLKGHAVDVDPSAGDLTVTVNALGLHMACCVAVECCMDQLEDPGRITLRTGRHMDGLSIEFIGSVGEAPVTSPPTRAEAWHSLQDLVSGLGASAESSDTECNLRIVLPGG